MDSWIGGCGGGAMVGEAEFRVGFGFLVVRRGGNRALYIHMLWEGGARRLSWSSSREADV